MKKLLTTSIVASVLVVAPAFAQVDLSNEPVAPTTASGEVIYYLQSSPVEDTMQTTSVGLANPASLNCDKLGGTLSIKKDATGGEYGLCTFKNGKTIEEWALFRSGITSSAYTSYFDEALFAKYDKQANALDVAIKKLSTTKVAALIKAVDTKIASIASSKESESKKTTLITRLSMIKYHLTLVAGK